ncbi:MAG: FAD-binding protein [Methanobrevibacter sp.]|uniref:FAD-binding protein n=1 Tax=Methanobrevibacter sp. TaxID=66852 RepID=UPI001B50FF91|nr:FAD-binding protein [Methanobrevibacter sp.]MBP3792110.1 FAD-binding protein [Methanobrevibacter sp.]
MNKVIVVGAGMAGLTAAIRASDNAEVDLISLDYSERSQSVMAMGGINAALNTKGQDDSTEQHYADTMHGGCEINDAEAVLRLTADALKIVEWLSEIGTSFTRDENGNIDLRYFGGQKKQRTAYAGARTGKQIVTALIGQCRKREVEGKVTRHVGWRFVSLIFTDKRECAGVVCVNEDSGEIKSFTGDAVIIATGGLNSLFGKTVGSTQNDGYATARLLTQGVQLANLEMIQYHPTTVRTPNKRMLITEAARGEGGKLYVLRDGEKWYFMKEWYPELAELMPRDVVSKSIYKASNGGEKEVYLDITHLDEDTIRVKLDEVYDICTKYLNLNPIEEPIPIFPGVHYFMGGIRTDADHRTNIKGLYAAGECSSQYHGANRLGGNSLLGAIHGGWIAAENAILEKPTGELIREEVNIPTQNDGRLAEIMNRSMSIYRDEENLTDALNELNGMEESPLIILAKACIMSAIERKESRGAHQRTDYPQSSSEFEKASNVTYDGEINVFFE